MTCSLRTMSRTASVIARCRSSSSTSRNGSPALHAAVAIPDPLTLASDEDERPVNVRDSSITVLGSAATRASTASDAQDQQDEREG